MARPKKLPPADAVKRIRELSAEGHAIAGIAERFNIAVDTLSRWFDEHAEIKQAFDQGRERERWALHNMLYLKAMAGDVTAACVILNARHGYRTDQSEQANRVSIVFQLPGAMPMASFIEAQHVPLQPVSSPVKLINKR